MYVDPSRVINAILNRGSIVLVAPTGSGKTHSILVASGELLRRIVKKVLIAEPTRAAVAEVHKKAVQLYGEQMVGRDDSDARLDVSWRASTEWAKPIVVSTYERIDSVANTDPTILRDAFLVIDEAHQMLMKDRATAIIDLLALAKMTKAKVAVMSATMPEMENLAKYLNAELYVHNADRKIDIETVNVQVWMRGARPYYDRKVSALLDMIKSKKLTKEDAPILVYVPSRKWSEFVAAALHSSLGDEWHVAVHHAGRPYLERKMIEEELRKKKPGIDIVVATDTLSQAVNMAFKTVVVIGIKRFMKGGVAYQEPSLIRQVIGRAGRPGYHERGKAIIIMTSDEREVVEKALNSDYGEVTGIKDYLAQVVRLRATRKDPELWAKYAYKVDKYAMSRAIEVAKQIGLMKEDGSLTPLGMVMAYEYLPGYSLPALLFITSRLGDAVRERLSPVDSTYFMASMISYYISKLWTQINNLNIPVDVYSKPFANRVRNISNVAEDVVSVFSETESEEYQSLMTKVEAVSDLYPELSSPLSDGITPPLQAYLAITSPGVGDNVAESVRKGAQVVASMARAGLVKPAEGKAAVALQRVMKGARLLQRLAPDYVADFVDSMISLPPESVEKLSHKKLVDIYLESVATGTPVPELVAAELAKRKQRLGMIRANVLQQISV